jgi:exodeoxyribonuclease VII large subunit
LPRLIDLVGIPRQRLDGAASRLGQALLGFTRTKRGQFQRFDGRLQPHILMNRIIRGRERIGLFRQALGRTMVQRLKFSRETHNRLRGGLRPQMMMKAISQGGQDLHNLQDRRDRAIRSNLQQKRQRLQTLSQLMNSLGYQNVLARGFALVRDEAGEMVRGVTHLNSGDMINVEFVDGKVLAEIQGADGNGENKKAIKKSVPVSQKPKKAKKIKKNDDGTDGGAQGSLF